MSEIADQINEAVEKGKESRLNTIVAALVAITATFTALCNVKDGNVVQAMEEAQSKGVDAWAYYQAKSTKQSIAEDMVDTLTIQRDLESATLSAESRGLLDKKIIEYTAKAKLYEKEKSEIKEKAESYQTDYEALNVHDDQFDMADAALSISIALFGVTALTQKRWLLFIGATFMAFGFLLGIAGFLKLNLHPDFLARLLT